MIARLSFISILVIVATIYQYFYIKHFPPPSVLCRVSELVWLLASSICFVICTRLKKAGLDTVIKVCLQSLHGMIMGAYYNKKFLFFLGPQ